MVWNTNTGDVDDTTRSGHQVGETLLAELHSRLEVDLHGLLNILHAHVLEVGSEENASVVYQNIKPWDQIFYDKVNIMSEVKN